MPPAKRYHLRLSMTGFNPTIHDVIEVRFILTKLGISNKKVPIELALMILSFASYGPYHSSIKDEKMIYRADEFWRPGPWASVAGLYLTAATLPNTILKAKSVTFQMRAADQGWADFGGNGTYRNSHTWFEASILRPRSQESTAAALTDKEVMNFPTPIEARDYLQGLGWDMVERNGSVVWKVHNNITARSNYWRYRADWVADIPTPVDDPRALGDGQGFLELLRPGDVIALWARAEQQAWFNKVRGATIEIQYQLRLLDDI